MDQSELFWEVAHQKARLRNLPKDELTKLRSAQILRSHAGKSDFIRAAVEVAKNLSLLRTFVGTHRRDYVQPGKLEEVEREKIEQQVAEYVRSCTENIRILEAGIQRNTSTTPQVNAYQHGVALILSERLQGISTSFDVCRSLRYQQLNTHRQRQQKRQRELQQAQAHSTARSAPSRAVTWDKLSSPRQGHAGSESQAQQQIHDENWALQQELQDLGQQVRQTEKSMHEIAALSQMFSAQVMQQSEQTLQLYNQAVEASEFVVKGNVNLEKAIRLNSSTRKLMFCFFFVASLLLLLFDWWYS